MPYASINLNGAPFYQDRLAVYSMLTDAGVSAEKIEGDDLSVDDCLTTLERSRFLFHKGQLSLAQVIQRNLQNADLAFLSACQTSTGAEILPDEAVHLAAGMLAAGYQRVVATMWSIGDQFAPDVAKDFYRFILDHGEKGGEAFDGALSAHALHHAVQNLRKRLNKSPDALLLWAPYVHFGY